MKPSSRFQAHQESDEPLVVGLIALILVIVAVVVFVPIYWP